MKWLIITVVLKVAHIVTEHECKFGSWLRHFYVKNDSYTCMYEFSPILNDWTVIQLVPVIFLFEVKIDLTKDVKYTMLILWKHIVIGLFTA